MIDVNRLLDRISNIEDDDLRAILVDVLNVSLSSEKYSPVSIVTNIDNIGEMNFLTDEDLLAMKNTEHGLGDHKNPYHQEGSVYNHTKLVVDEILKNTDSLMLAAAAILHDIGKPISRKENQKKNRAYFKGHQGISAYKSVKYAEMLGLDVGRLFKLIALHSVLFDHPTEEVVLTSMSRSFWSDLKVLIDADIHGRISQDSSNNDSIVEILNMNTNDLLDRYVNIDDHNPIAILVIGPQSTYKDNFVKGVIENTERLYRLTEINKDNISELDMVISRRENILINLDNLRRSSRTKLTNRLKGVLTYYNIEYFVLVNDYDELIEEGVCPGTTDDLNNKLASFQFPLRYNEPVRNIKTIRYKNA